MNGYTVADGGRSRSFGDLKADGSTACGAWIYSGVYAPTAQEPDGHNFAANRQGDDWVALGWGFAWPANRRILYNRASADPLGQSLAQGGPARQGPRQGARKATSTGTGKTRPIPARHRWVGLDVPDFPVNKPPNDPGQAGRQRARLPRRRLALHHEVRRQRLAVRPLGGGRRAVADALRAL